MVKATTKHQIPEVKSLTKFYKIALKELRSCVQSYHQFPQGSCGTVSSGE